MNTPIEHTEHRTDRDPLQGTGPAFARLAPRRNPDRPAPWALPDDPAES